MASFTVHTIEGLSVVPMCKYNGVSRDGYIPFTGCLVPCKGYVSVQILSLCTCSLDRAVDKKMELDDFIIMSTSSSTIFLLLEYKACIGRETFCFDIAVEIVVDYLRGLKTNLDGVAHLGHRGMRFCRTVFKLLFEICKMNSMQSMLFDLKI